MVRHTKRYNKDIEHLMQKYVSTTIRDVITVQQGS